MSGSPLDDILVGPSLQRGDLVMLQGPLVFRQGYSRGVRAPIRDSVVGIVWNKSGFAVKVLTPKGFLGGFEEDWILMSRLPEPLEQT